MIEKNLIKNGFEICVIESYKKVLKILDEEKEIKKWRLYNINTLVATSSEILYQLKKVTSKVNQLDWLLGCRIFVVGKRLFKIAKLLGWKDIIVSDCANNRCLLKTIEKNKY